MYYFISPLKSSSKCNRLAQQQHSRMYSVNIHSVNSLRMLYSSSTIQNSYTLEWVLCIYVKSPILSMRSQPTHDTKHNNHVFEFSGGRTIQDVNKWGVICCQRLTLYLVNLMVFFNDILSIVFSQ